MQRSTGLAAMATMLLWGGIRPTYGQDISMDLVVTCDPGGDSASLEWFPASVDGVSRFEIRCYDASGAPLSTESAAADLRGAVLGQVQALGIEAVEVCAIDAAGEVLALTPREPIWPGTVEEAPAIGADSQLTSPQGGGLFGPMDYGPLGGGQLGMSLVSCDSRNFPFVYLTVRVNEDGQPIDSLTKDDFSVTEDGRPQANYFDVTPPQSGGGVRLADIVFLIDTSGSMGSEIAAVRNNCIAFANALAASDIDYRLGLVQFGQSSSSGNPRIIGGGLTASAQTFKNWVGTLGASGGTEPGFAAIRLAIQNYNFRPGAQKVFLIITDEDSDDRNKTATINLITANDVTVHAAVLCSSGSSQADYCGTGSVRDVSGGLLFSVTGNYTSILDTISGDVANSYIVRYQTDNPALDGQERQVVCTATKDTSSASVLCTYVPGGAPMIERTPATIALHNTSLVAGSSPTIAVTVTDAAAPFVQGVTLYVRKTGSTGGYTAINMIAQGSDVYAADVPGSHVQGPGLEYYIRATDGQVTSSDPSSDPDISPYQIAVLPNEVPVIDHTPPEWWLSGHDCPLTIHATDTTYHVRKIWIYYRTKGEILYQGVGKTYAPGTTDVTETLPCYGSKFVEPAAEYYIEVTDDLGVSRRWPEGGADAPYELKVRGPVSGYVDNGHGHRLPCATIRLKQDKLFGGYNRTVNANENGEFEFPTAADGWVLPSGTDYRLRVYLKYRPPGESQDVFEVIYHGPGGSSGPAQPYIETEAFDPSIQQGALTLSFGNGASLTTNPMVPAALHDDLAGTYYYLAQFFLFAKATIGWKPDLDLPLEYYAYKPMYDEGLFPKERRGAYYQPWFLHLFGSEIYAARLTSNYGDPDQPMNLEWHETAHYMMDDVLGLPSRPFGDRNHGGYANSSTADSWAEGWAEFWPCELKRSTGQADPHLYRWLGGADNFESPLKAWNDEEFAVASVLWDLVDGIDATDNDYVQISTQGLWNIFTGAASTNDFADIFSALRAAQVGTSDTDQDGVSDLEEIFADHGFFADLNTSRSRDLNEQIGRAAYAANPTRRDKPVTPSEAIKFTLVQVNGDAVLGGRVHVEYHFAPPYGVYNFSYEIDVAQLDDGKLQVHPDGSDLNPEIIIWCHDGAGGSSERLAMLSNDYRDMSKNSEDMFSLAHQFTIGAQGTVRAADVFAAGLNQEATWFPVCVELMPGQGAEQIDLGSVRIEHANGKKLGVAVEAANDPNLPFVQTRQTSDKDSDGRLELLVKFPKPAVLAALADGSTGPLSITVRWTDSQGSVYEGTAFLGSVQDVTSSLGRTIGAPRFDRRTGRFTTAVTLTNTSQASIAAPLYLAFDAIVPATVTLASPDGTTDGGDPYIDLSDLLGDGQLDPGESVTKQIWFNNPSRARFTFETTVLGVPAGE